MHALVEERLAPGGVCQMTQQRSGGGRWQSLDGGRGADDGGSVIPRQAPRHGVTEPSHEDTLVKMLYEEHAGPLLMFVLRLTGGDRQRAEDIVQETLLRAWKHPEVLDPERGSPRGWLFTVARRLVVDDWRTKRSRVETLPGDLPEQSRDDDTDQILQSWVVADALRQLSDEHRAVLIECYYHGRTVADAARVLGIPEGTVKSRSHYALLRLRVALQEMGVTR
jgi:RNA polymerase sigma-70 factor (ECF subfamily)